MFDLRILAENCGITPDLFFPFVLVKGRRRKGLADKNLGLLAGEIRRRIFFFRPYLGPGLYFQIGLRRFLVHAVSVQPQDARNGVRLIFQRQGGCGYGIKAVLAVGVVQISGADPDGNVSRPLAAVYVGHDAAIAGDDHVSELIIGRIADEIGNRVRLAQ